MVRYELSRSGTLQFSTCCVCLGGRQIHITLQALLPRGTCYLTDRSDPFASDAHAHFTGTKSVTFLALFLYSFYFHHFHHPHNTHTAYLPLSNHATNHSHSHHHHHYHARPNPITPIILIIRKRRISPRAPTTHHQTTQHPPTHPHHNSLEPLRPQKRRRLVPPTSNPTPHRRQSPLYQSSRGTRRDQSI